MKPRYRMPQKACPRRIKTFLPVQSRTAQIMLLINYVPNETYYFIYHIYNHLFYDIFGQLC